jgi:hypothetical protein
VSEKATSASGTRDAQISVVDEKHSILYRTIRQRIDAGELPSDVNTDKCWAGKSGGGRCSGCDGPIQPDETEYEVAMNEGDETLGSLVFHRRCLDIWVVECKHRAG